MDLVLRSRLELSISMASKDTFPVNVESKRYSLSVMSYNCRGFNFVKSSYINNLLLNCDILFVQEHWLSDKQLPDLNHINEHFLSHMQFVVSTIVMS